jgi:CcmD family protein
MSDLTYLFVAFALIWTGVLAYLMRLAGLRRQLETRIDRLQERLENKERNNG